MVKDKQENQEDIHIASWNVRGLRKLIKLKKVLNRIKHLKSKMFFFTRNSFDCLGYTLFH